MLAALLSQNQQQMIQQQNTVDYPGTHNEPRCKQQPNDETGYLAQWHSLSVLQQHQKLALKVICNGFSQNQ